MASRPMRDLTKFEIIGSRRLGLESCEFDVVVDSGDPVVGELFPIQERGSLWEFIIVGIDRGSDLVTLRCVTWLPGDGAFVGLKATTRAMTAVDKKRYAKALPANLLAAKKSAC